MMKMQVKEALRTGYTDKALNTRRYNKKTKYTEEKTEKQRYVEKCMKFNFKFTSSGFVHAFVSTSEYILRAPHCKYP